MRKLAVIFTIIFFFSGLAFAQEQYGNIRGVVLDEQSHPLPGVTVTLDSELYNPRSINTPEGGIFRFINVPVGRYRVKCELPGFKTHILESIALVVGLNVDLKISMEPVTLEEKVVVVANYPAVDMKKTGTSTTFTQEMLQEIPSARDPWVILQHTAGLLMDRENVGGSESGMQSLYLSKGKDPQDTMWNMDGIPITDMVITGTSSMYYDFDTFEEIQITTSGQDASKQTGGISIDFVTRRGTNKFQVIGQAYFTNDKLQGDNRTQELLDLNYVGNRINQIMDYGLQAGGPIQKDRLWFWLGYGVQDIRKLTIDGYPEDTKLEGFNAKINFNISRNNRMELAFIRNNKRALGRGSAPNRAPETTQDQDGPTNFLKFEDEHAFSDNFLLNIKISYSWGMFELVPKGGMDVQPGSDDYTQTIFGSYDYVKEERPSFVLSLDGNYFIENILGGDHELKFGAIYQSVSDWCYQAMAGDAWRYYWNGEPLFAEVTREGIWDTQAKRFGIYLSDSYTKGRMTFNFGLRLDIESSRNNDLSVKASRVAPDLLPAMIYPGIDPGVNLLTLSPRFGLTYDITGNGKTILRANIARYGSQTGVALAEWISTSSQPWAGYFWNDLNGDDRVSTDELAGYPTDGILWFWGFNPWNPTDTDTPNTIDPDLKNGLTDEFILGLEREVFSHFSLSANFIYRRNHHSWWYPYYDKTTGWKQTLSDTIGPFKGSITHEGVTYDYEYWTLNRYRPAGVYIENRPDYHENYRAFEVAAKKRISHRWMMNASFTYQVHTVHFGERGYLDPTNKEMLDGSRYDWLGSDWIVKLSFLYQLPWGLNFSCFANARQGYVRKRYILVPTPESAIVGGGATTAIYTEKPGTTRLPNFYNMDVSLAKEIHLDAYGTLSLYVDAFNVFNFSHTLGQFSRINSERYDEIARILNPRLIRFGIRYSF